MKKEEMEEASAIMRLLEGEFEKYLEQKGNRSGIFLSSSG